MSTVFLALSKLLPIFVYPVGLTCILLLLAYGLPQRLRWQRHLVGAAFLLLWLASSRLVAMGLVRSLEWRYLPAAEVPTAAVMVVLGGGTKSADYPRQTVEIGESGDRILYAAWLYQQGKADHILLSGGNISLLSSPAASTEAEDMAQVLHLMQIPEEAIWLEMGSRNTYENAVNSRQFLAEKGIDQILLVTSAIHMPRAVALFEHQGFEVVPLPTDFVVTQQGWAYYAEMNLWTQLSNFLPTVSSLMLTTHALKEYMGLAVYKWQGWL